MAIEAYPLSWPAGVKRSASRRRAEFGAMKIQAGRSYATKTTRSVQACVDELQRQTKLLAGTGLVISTNIKLRQDGLPYSNQPRLLDPGACIYFSRNKVPYAFPCDKWDRVEDNLWAVAKHLDAMRGTERWGVGSVEQQFLGYKSLPAVAGEGEDAWLVLGLPAMGGPGSADAIEFVIRDAHRNLSRHAHPDRGGSAEQMARINVARDQAIAALKARA